MAGRANDVQERVFELLLSKVEQDRYPSNQQLDLLERYMSDSGREQLIAVLSDKVSQDRYPSLPMLRRLLRLSAG
jgi:hypothetical protein